jgi:hypothetical protein
MNEVGYGLEELLEFGKAINVQSGKFGAKGMSIWLARE